MEARSFLQAMAKPADRLPRILRLSRGSSAFPGSCPLQIPLVRDPAQRVRTPMDGQVRLPCFLRGDAFSYTFLFCLCSGSSGRIIAIQPNCICSIVEKANTLYICIEILWSKSQLRWIRIYRDNDILVIVRGRYVVTREYRTAYAGG